MKIKKAIITAAGFGTRFLPITKTIQKEMLPVLNKPMIDYLVDDCVNAGIEEIIFVVKENDTQIQHYYAEDLSLKGYLERMKKPEKYSSVEGLHTKAKFSFVYEKENDPYGTTMPVWLSREYVQNEEAFLILGGDDYIYNKDGSNEVKKKMETFEKSGAEGLMNCINVPKEIVHKYGIAEYKEE
jgi:UTP--glucose-1-phosphate uridylyltransferase